MTRRPDALPDFHDDAIADIAARLHLSPGSVCNHLPASIQKLGARNRAEAVQIAQQKGWL